MNARDAAKQSAMEFLKETLKPGDTVYTILRHVSRSGMQRVIDAIAFVQKPGWSTKDAPTPLWIGGSVSLVLDRRYNTRERGVVENGGGMDMGWHLVNSLSQAMFGEGGKLEQRWL